MSGKSISAAEVLELIPQQHPFRFIDEIVELDEHRIESRYTFREDESFYPGHFPGNPVTPGVILLEAMAQTGLVALGLYLLAMDNPLDEVRKMITFFSDAEVEFRRPVYPGETITIKGEKIYWRRNKLKSKTEVINSKGEVVAFATVSGMGVRT